MVVKKFVLLALILVLLLAGLSSWGVYHYYFDEFHPQIVDLSKIILQAMLTGAVTFLGLFFTIFSQEGQNKKQKELDFCPCIIVNDFGGLSTTRDIGSINDTEKIVVCCSDDIIRTIDLSICNCKFNYGLNLSVESNSGEYYLGNIKNENINIKITLKNDDYYLVFKFEDAYGLKYEQKIKYQYDNKMKSIRFISCQPTRRKK